MVSVSLRHEQAATPEQNRIVSAAHHHAVSGSEPALETAAATAASGTVDPADAPSDAAHVESVARVEAVESLEHSGGFDWDHPENDPSHPRYEPPHLRHRPGDTWQIGRKQFDIDDPGPYGNPP